MLQVDSVKDEIYVSLWRESGDSKASLVFLRNSRFKDALVKKISVRFMVAGEGHESIKLFIFPVVFFFFCTVPSNKL